MKRENQQEKHGILRLKTGQRTARPVEPIMFLNHVCQDQCELDHWMMQRLQSKRQRSTVLTLIYW
ncbi:hypothetical protein D3099_16895 [Escherichia coli]|nr:hypothetical protein [Escherichia coli]